MGEAGCFAALAWVIVCPCRNRFFSEKIWRTGPSLCIFAFGEVRLHLSIAFENEFSSSAFGLH